MAPNEIENHFGTDSSTGLDEATALQRLAQFGPNRLAEAKQQAIWQVFLEEIREPMILLLLGTGVLYSVCGNVGDALTILCVILLLVGAEVFNEYRAKKAIVDSIPSTNRSSLFVAKGRMRRSTWRVLFPAISSFLRQDSMFLPMRVFWRATASPLPKPRSLASRCPSRKMHTSCSLI
jgi:magnesium-transporting ATPase (P-type)